MSRFVDTLELYIDNCGLTEMVTSNPSVSSSNSKFSKQLSKDDEEQMKAASQRVQDGSKDPQDVKLAQTHTRLKSKFDQKIKDLLRKGNYVLSTEAEEKPSPILDPENQQNNQQSQPKDASTPQPEPGMTHEGEVFLVNLIRKAFFINYTDLDLNENEIKTLTSEVTPENSTQVLQTLNNLIETYG